MKLSRIAAAIALATTVATPLVASAQWAFDNPYWKEQLSRKPNSEARPVDRSAGSDFFGRPLVRLEGTEGFTPFEPLPQFWARTHPQQPASYAAGDTPLRDAPTVDEAPARPSGAALVEGANEERRALERSGFTQFAQ